jgi:hypothetical protein
MHILPIRTIRTFPLCNDMSLVEVGYQLDAIVLEAFHELAAIIDALQQPCEFTFCHF